MQHTSLAFTISWSLVKLMHTESMLPSNRLILCHPLLLPSIFPSIRVFSGESALCITLPNCCSFSISPSNEYSELISFRIDWFDLCAVQWTLKSLLQDHSLKASALQCSAFFMVHLYVTTGKTTALTITLSLKSRFCFTICYPGLSWLFSQGASILISWQQALSAVILEPPQRKICHYLHFFPFYLP